MVLSPEPLHAPELRSSRTSNVKERSPVSHPYSILNICFQPKIERLRSPRWSGTSARKSMPQISVCVEGGGVRGFSILSLVSSQAHWGQAVRVHHLRLQSVTKITPHSASSHVSLVCIDCHGGLVCAVCYIGAQFTLSSPQTLWREAVPMHILRIQGSTVVQLDGAHPHSHW